jgi:predicted nucleotidyltransferase
MALPEFNDAGDLPLAVHRATLDEVVSRFGSTRGKRSICTRRLRHIYELAERTGMVQRFIVFGSYVTAEPNPNDVDVVLVMEESFRLQDCPIELQGLFDHAVAQARYGASIFWVRPELLLGESLEEFVASWQIKRDGTERGIVEVIR